MEFKLVLIPKNPEQYILKAEKPLAGLSFIEEAAACLKRNLDTQTRMRHITMGNISQYEISVPQALAIDSGWFETKSCRYISCSEDFLKNYIFYGATMGTVSSKRPVYPYYENEVVLISYADELRLLEDWKSHGYPAELSATTIPDEDDSACTTCPNPSGDEEIGVQ